LAFLRVVEVFPPTIPAAGVGGSDPEAKEPIESFVRSIREIRDLADVVLVASLKKPGLYTLPTIDSALRLRKKLGVDAAPVLLVRDKDRLQLLSSVVAGLVGGLKSMMLVWGDADKSLRPPTIIGFAGLSDALAKASEVREKARSRCLFFAPVDLRRLFTTAGVALARDRLKAGASMLLAQPPTTDADETFDSHSRLVAAAGLDGKVLPNVFPFRSPQDVSECEKYFGWRLPKRLHASAKEGEASLLATQKDVVRRLRSEHFPGVYVSTRGDPSYARTLLS